MRNRFGLGIVLATVLASFAYAQPFTYQGFLKDNGVPANGTYDFLFRLYDAPTGDQPSNPPTIYTTLNVQNGLFTVTLDFGTAVWNGVDRYLDIAVRRTGSGPVFSGLQPRVKINPTPYASYALRPWQTSGSNIFYTNGNVGIGTNSPVHKLHVAGGHAFFAENVGINTASPAQRLHVAGTGCFEGFLGVGTTNPWVRLSLGDTNANTKLALWQGTNAGELMGFGIAPNQFRIHLHQPGNRFSFLDAPNGNELVTIEGNGRVLLRGNWLSLGGGTDPYNNNRVLIQVRDTGQGYVGYLATLGPNRNRNVILDATGNPNHGNLAVVDASNLMRAGMFIDDTGRGIVWGDTKNFRVPDPDDPTRDIWYASIEGPEAAMYVRGTAQLVSGRARIELPDYFRKLADEQDMTVQLTPRSGESKGLAAVRVSLDGIEVVELHNGRGNYAFDWEVKAVRKEHRDFQVYRPWDEVLPAGTDPAEAWEARLKSIEARQQRQQSRNTQR